VPELAPQSLRRASDAVEDFRGDYDRLAAMMQASWSESPAASYLYTAELLADCLAYPGADHTLAPSIYNGPELVAFAAGLPRRVTIGGAEHRIVISTYLTVAPGHKTAGYGIVVWSELMRRAAAQGFAGAVNYCVDRGEMDHMIDGCCRLAGLPLTKAASFFYLTRPLGDAMVAPAMPVGQDRASADDLIEAARGLDAQLGISRLWTASEAAWQLARVDAVSARASGHGRPGVLTGYVMTFDNEARTRLLVVDDILWGGTTGAQRVGLVNDLLAKGVALGASAAAVPLIGYAEMRPFAAAGFLPSPHTLNAYLVHFPVAAAAPALQPGYYLDVQ
jgi:hypothetical protein